MSEQRELDLDNPVDARFFLRTARIEGKIITVVVLDDGKELEIEKMTDAQAIRYAKDIYIDFLGGVEGERGSIELDTEGMNQ